jgi:hypothetical protein
MIDLPTISPSSPGDEKGVTEKSWDLLKEEVDRLRTELQQMKAYIDKMPKRELEIQNLRLGAGNEAIHADNQGLWAGQKKLSDAKTGGFAVGIDGTLYATVSSSDEYTLWIDGVNLKYRDSSGTLHSLS